jgi:hypothetical protein
LEQSGKRAGYLAKAFWLAILPVVLSANMLLTGVNSGLHHSAFAQESKILYATDDAYVVADLNDPSDKLGLAKLNTGKKDFLKTWYAWGVTADGKERILSIVYLKFDTTNLDSADIESAHLELTPFIANLTASARAVDVYATTDRSWDESTIVYEGAPALKTSSNATQTITSDSVNSQVSWDVTDIAKDYAGKNMTLAVLIKSMNKNNEEQVVFRSTEFALASERPKLVLQVSTAGTASDSQDLLRNYGPILIGVAAAAGAGGFAAGMMLRKGRRNSDQEPAHASPQ